MTHMPPPTRLLRQILSIGDDMENLSRLHLPSTTLSHTAIEHYPPCPLPRPQPLYTELINLGLENNIAKRISDKSLQSALDLRACAEASMHEAIAKTTTSRHPDLQSAGDIQHSLFLAYKRTYLRMIAQWKEGIIKMATKQCSPVAEDIEDTPQHLPRSRRDFNYEFIPFLEKYFEYNPYPSAPDRAILARKSMMSPRQIEVWFQNHRNRAKKDGKTLQRMTPGSLPLKLSLESLEEKMPFFTIPEHERKLPGDREVSVLDTSDEEHELPSIHEVAHTNDSLNTPSPPHAFPAIFPPQCDYTPFPATPSFPSPTWMRKPAVSIQRKAPVDFDDFVTAFATMLILREDRRKQPTRSHRSPWFSATRIVAPAAPHPAFIAPIKATSTSPPPCIPLPSIPAPSLLYQNVFVAPTSCSLLTLIPGTPQEATATQRKVARLPRRTPKNASVAHRGTSPVTSEALPLLSVRSLTPSSKISSFSPDGSSQRCPSSSSSASSSSSSMPPTPLLFSPRLLPGNIESLPLTSPLEFNCEHMGDLFRESPIDALSPITEPQHNSHTGALSRDSTSNKSMPTFHFDIHSAHYVETRS